jgi:hypothetical protein
MVSVYGAAQDAELVRMCENDPLPIMVGGNFNIIRHQEEKINDNFNARWPFIFNTIIESLDLRELALSGRQFIWANHKENPTFENLDRVLASISWEQKFPLVTVRALTRAGSDHTPLLVNSGEQAHRGNKAFFFHSNYHGCVRKDFLIWWLQCGTRYLTVITPWGWARNQSSVYKKEK